MDLLAFLKSMATSHAQEDLRPHNRAFGPKQEATIPISNKDFCVNCNKIGKGSLCSGCKEVRYCSSECQRENWMVHSIYCNPSRIYTKDIKERNSVLENTLASTTLSHPKVYRVLSAVAKMIVKFNDNKMISRGIVVTDDGKAIMVKVYLMDLEDRSKYGYGMQFNRRVRREVGELEENEYMVEFKADMEVPYKEILRQYVSNLVEFNEGNEEFRMEYR